jgi:2'-5' RNA ligase
MDTKSIRAFIAIELPPPVRALLATVQEELRESLGGAERAVKWVRPDGTHLTLQFLGDVQANQIPAIRQGIERACEQAGPIGLNLERLGVFPNLRRPRVIWVGLTGSREHQQRLDRLQHAITSNMQPLGFKPDKSFKPHLTLGRVRDTATSAELAAIAEVLEYPEEQPLFETTFQVRAVSLMRSDLQPGGAVYTELAHIELQGKA